MTAGEMVALARQAQGGDAAARHDLLVELYRCVQKRIYFLFGSRQFPDDVAQQTTIELIKGLAGFRGDTASPQTWALTIATREAYRMRAQEKRYELIEDGVVDVEIFDL